MKKLSDYQRKLISYGTGAGLGIVVPFAIKKYVDPNYPSPLTPYIGVWGKWSTFIPIITGAGALFVTLVAGHYMRGKGENVKGMVAMYGFASLVTGVMAGLVDMGYLGARASANLGARTRYATATNMVTAPVVRQATAQLSNGVTYTPTGISNKIIRA